MPVKGKGWLSARVGSMHLSKVVAPHSKATLWANDVVVQWQMPSTPPSATVNEATGIACDESRDGKQERATP